MPELMHPLSTPLFTRFQKSIIALTVIIALFGIFRTHLPNKYSFAASNTVAIPAKNTYAPPTYINIPSLSLGLPLFQTDTSIHRIIFTKSVEHPTNSAYPGQVGNIVLLGSNNDETFGKILELPKGETIVVVTKDGAGHEYIVDELLLVNPNDKRIYEATPLETLTLVTPAGFLGTKRFVIKAIPSSL